MACPCCSASRCPVCPGKTCQIDWPADGAVIGTVSYNNKGTYYTKRESVGPPLPGLPLDLAGVPSTARSQSIWKVGTVAGPEIPAPPVPEYTWNAGYPADLQNCAYWVLDGTSSMGLGADCCRIFASDPVTFLPIPGACLIRGDRIGEKGTFRWRLMLLDCNTESLTDITDAAITKVGVFEGTYDQFLQPIDRTCASTTFNPLPGYFGNPQVVCS